MIRLAFQFEPGLRIAHNAADCVFGQHALSHPVTEALNEKSSHDAIFTRKQQHIATIHSQIAMLADDALPSSAATFQHESIPSHKDVSRFLNLVYVLSATQPFRARNGLLPPHRDLEDIYEERSLRSTPHRTPVSSTPSSHAPSDSENEKQDIHIACSDTESSLSASSKEIASHNSSSGSDSYVKVARPTAPTAEQKASLKRSQKTVEWRRWYTRKVQASFDAQAEPSLKGATPVIPALLPPRPPRVRTKPASQQAHPSSTAKVDSDYSKDFDIAKSDTERIDIY
jgi:hypothetical protein